MKNFIYFLGVASLLFLIIVISLNFNDIISVFIPNEKNLLLKSKEFGIEYKNLLTIYEFKIKLITGLVALIGIALAVWRTYILDKNFKNDTKKLEHQKKQLENDSKKLENQEKNIEFERDKFNRQRLDERYSKAIELLGSDKISVRTGALYTLKNLVEEDGFL